MSERDRRHFLKHALAIGGTALWSGHTTQAAEQGERLVADNASDAIRDIELFRIRTIRTKYHFVMVRIRTRNGLVGYGECYAVENTLPWLAKYMKSLEGRQLSGLINRFYLEALKDYNPEIRNHGEMHTSIGWCGALSCLEIALWDILGKMANQPVHELLGGAIRDRVPVYANHAVFKGDGPPPFERILRVKELGYDMFKWTPFGGRIRNEKDVHEKVEFIAKVREALGPDMKLAVDAHCRWGDAKMPKIAAKAMEPLNMEFFEEPCHHAHIEAFVELAESTSVPLATGEHMTHPDEVRKLVPTGALRYLQLDVGNFGGLAATHQSFHFAKTYGVDIATHNWAGPIATLATLQLTAVIPNLFRQEWPHAGYGQDWETQVVAPELVVRQGRIDIPRLPGIGAVPDMERLEKLRVVD